MVEKRDIAVKIAEFHKCYQKEFLEDKIKNKYNYLKSPKKALFFILSYSFYQGRRDELSKKFEENAKNALEKFLLKNDVFSSNSQRVKDKNTLKSKYNELNNLLKQFGVNKEGDRLMVISLINFIQSNAEKNILKTLVQKIKSKKISEAHKILDSIWSIGPKIASLILRDIVYIYELEGCIDGDNYNFLQPVDTWVHKISKEIGLIEKNKDKIYPNEAKDITNKCLELGINPIHYNQGVWYLGKHSLEILLKNIGILEKRCD